MDYRVTDLVQRIHLGNGLLVAFCHLQSGIMEGLPGTVASRERECGRFADLTDAQRIDEPVERDRTPGLDGIEEVAYGCHTETLLLEQFASMLPLQCEDVGRLLHPLFFKEQFDLLLAQPFDIEGPA